MAAALLFAMSAATARAATLSDSVAELTRIDLVGSTMTEILAAARVITTDVPAGLCPRDSADDLGPKPAEQAKRQPDTSGLLVLVPIPPKCDVAGEVVGLRLQFARVNARAGQQIASVASSRFGPSCFSGSLPADPRRRAPATPMIFWTDGDRVLALTRDAATSPAASVLYADLTPGPIGETRYGT